MRPKLIISLLALLLLVVPASLAVDSQVKCNFTLSDDVQVSGDAHNGYLLSCEETFQYPAEDQTKESSKLAIITSGEDNGFYAENSSGDLELIISFDNFKDLDLESEEDASKRPFITIKGISYFFVYSQLSTEVLEQLPLPEDYDIDLSSTGAVWFVGNYSSNQLPENLQINDDMIIGNEKGYAILFTEFEENVPDSYLFFNKDDEIILEDFSKSIKFEPYSKYEHSIALDLEQARERAREKASEILSTDIEENVEDENADIQCSDSDAEEDEPFDVFGYARGPRGESPRSVTVLEDFCAGNKILHEAVCKDGKVQVEIHECEDECHNGKCVDAASQEGLPMCIDLDNLWGSLLTRNLEGLKFPNFYSIISTKSATIGGYASRGGFGLNSLWTDYCANSKTLIEYSCDSDRVRFTKIICPNGCENDKCIEMPFCWESDGGNTKYYFGKTYAYHGDMDVADYADADSYDYEMKEDSCKDGNTLIEYYCNPENKLTGYNSTEIECDYGCSDGACIQTTECDQNEDCDDGFVCIDHECKQSCDDSTDCDQGSDGTTLGCINDVCVPCETDDACADGWTCNDDNRCEQPGCTSHLNCAVNEICNDQGECVAETIDSMDSLKEAIQRRLSRLSTLESILRQLNEFSSWCDFDGVCESGETTANCATDCTSTPLWERLPRYSAPYYFARDLARDYLAEEGEARTQRQVPDVKPKGTAGQVQKKSWFIPRF